MSRENTWAVRPAAANTAYFRVAATHGASASLTLLKTDFVSAGAINAAGYKVSFTTSADITANATAWIITGVAVGQMSGTTTETVTGPASATTVSSNTYWARVDTIVATGTGGGSSGAVTVAVGFSGGLALPRCRIHGVHFVGAAAAGTIVITSNGTSGTEILGIDTPASATISQYVNTNSIPVGRSAPTDYGVVTMTQVTKVTLFLE
jgi:hypothetical protein